MTHTPQQFENETMYTGEQILDRTIELLSQSETTNETRVSIPMDSSNRFLEATELASRHDVEFALESTRNTSIGLHTRKAMGRLSMMHEIDHVSGPTRTLVLNTEKTTFKAYFLERDIIGGFDRQVEAVTFTAESLLDSNVSPAVLQKLGCLLIDKKDPLDAEDEPAPARPRTTTKRFVKSKTASKEQTVQTLV